MTKLLMIDDNPMEHTIARAIFKHHGFFEDSQHLNDCRAAKEYVEKHLQTVAELPDVILLDLNMDGFNGWDFLEYFHALQPILPKPISLYIFSSSISPTDHKLSVRYPFVKSFLIKPLSLQILEQISYQAPDHRING
ncbi:response regulator [Mucilaginibacter sp. SP1R1]|uniref:response regulator n=1 Tax=Mucilaginibacter sp. SP1R1 TaxID=2723091 RepID=UPI00161A6A88|nr:response regulator [Mucilaginibacter sp. SP1R1]MBB6148281.1 CheY-like chemotaxis protein [Mucilaginibacter sp. SP1R1]